MLGRDLDRLRAVPNVLVVLRQIVVVELFLLLVDGRRILALVQPNRLLADRLEIDRSGPARDARR